MARLIERVNVMRNCLSLSLGGLLLISQTPAWSMVQHNHNDDETSNIDREINSLASNLDNLVKVCGEIAIGIREKEGPGPIEQSARENGILAAPTEQEKLNVQQLPVSKTFGNPVAVGEWFDPHASISIVRYTAAPVCKILVSQSDWVDQVRPTLYELIQVGNFYREKIPEHEISAGIFQTVFDADLGPKIPITPLVKVTAFTAAANESPDEGNVQLSITVAIVAKEIN